MPENEPGALAWRVGRLEDALQARDLKHEREITDLEHEVKLLRDKGEARERNLFVAGITFLGGIILTLIGVIWANLGAIFPGRG